MWTESHRDEMICWWLTLSQLWFSLEDSVPILACVLFPEGLSEKPRHMLSGIYSFSLSIPLLLTLLLKPTLKYIHISPILLHKLASSGIIFSVKVTNAKWAQSNFSKTLQAAQGGSGELCFCPFAADRTHQSFLPLVGFCFSQSASILKILYAFPSVVLCRCSPYLNLLVDFILAIFCWFEHFNFYVMKLIWIFK